jgi:GNAT superfamily N-acetyltransferase
LPPGFTLERMDGAAVARYRRLHLAVGAEYLWFSRMRMGDAALAAILDNPAVAAMALVSTAERTARDIGQLELDFRDPGHVELEYFGLCAEAIGAGLGVALIAEALHRAKEGGAGALHVHTCTLDHPRALDFYRRAGFRPIRRAIEVLDDPRLDGTLPQNVAPSIPVLKPDQG